jgi:S-DNA-T family DNA segregation ATPase FtsK/SpoIIIE
VGDVRVEIHPDATVATLIEALSGHAGQQGHVSPASEVRLFRADATRPLDPTARVVDTRLVTGETVTLVESLVAPTESQRVRQLAAQVWGMPPDAPAPAAPKPLLLPADAPPDAPSEALTLDVTSGPEAGRLIPLRPGEVSVGRSGACNVVVDDPMLREEHFALQVTPDGRVFVAPDLEASSGVTVAGEELTEVRQLEQGEQLQAGASVFALRAPGSDETRRRDQMGQVPFNRVPYRRTVVRPQRFDDLAAPPSTPTRRRLSLATALSPAGGAVALVLITQRYLFLIMAVVSPVLLVYRHISNRRGGKRQFRREKAAFYERVDVRAKEVTQALEAERETRLEAAPALAELARQATVHMPRLWERNRTAGDLLDLRLGLGDAESAVVAPIGRGGDDDLRAEGVERLAHQHVVHDVPITLNPVDLGIVGLWGDSAQTAAVGRALLAQAACLHSPEDLVIAAGLGMTHLAGFEWLKWLPHVRSSTSPLDGDHVAVGPTATGQLLVNLLAVAADREERPGGAPSTLWPRVLVLLDEAAEADGALVSQLLEIAPDFGIHVVWLGEDELQVPRQCCGVVACPGTSQPGSVRFTDPDRAGQEVELDGTPAETARAIACALAPLRDASAASQTTAIPRIVPLLDVVGIDAPAPELIAERWEMPRPYGLEFPIGVSAEGRFGLDLVEQGPHTLIGGTSGAGKSELLQTLVLSMATRYSPVRLNFLFVDYKGGASSAAFRDLPHTVGYVTNLSERTSMRALTSLRAELERRMALLEGRARDLAEMLTVAPAEAPPSLVIVVDEFAALVKRIPDFVTGIVDIAQRGRSLGIHLVLATQRPTGVVNDNILANTNLRISMRVLDPSDSNNIIGTRDAADIPVPLRGRAYARTGPRTLVPFQCAWSSAPYSTKVQMHAASVQPFTVDGLQADGPQVVAAETDRPGMRAPAGDQEPPTQLETLVQACAGAARRLALPPARRPWVEPLSDLIDLSDVLELAAPLELAGDPGRFAVVGMYDDPENQAQHVSTVDLEASGGLIVFGTGGSGKTTLLRTLAVGLARQGSPAELQIYGLDFASRALVGLSDLPHCGAVVPGDDAERVTRLLTVLGLEIERRRDLLATSRAESLGALRSSTGSPVVPRIVLLLDGYSGFHAAFDRADRYRWVAAFQRIVTAGRQVGVHCVLTTDRRQGAPPALLSAVSARLVLRMATAEELTVLGVPSKAAKETELPNGRGFVDGTTEVQVACVGGDPSGIAQSEAVAAVADELGSVHDGRAPGLPELPASVELDQPARQALMVPLAVADLTLDVVEVDLRRQNLVVVGPPLSGKSTTLETVAKGVRASMETGIQLFGLGGAVSPLAELKLWDVAAFSRATQAELVKRLGEVLGQDEGVEARAMLFVDAAEDLEAHDVVRPLEALAKRDALRLVVACEPSTAAKAYTGWLGTLRRNRSVLVLQPESTADVESAAGVKPTLRPEQAFPPGRGVFVANRQGLLVQVGLQSDETPDTGD